MFNASYLNTPEAFKDNFLSACARGAAENRLTEKQIVKEFSQSFYDDLAAPERWANFTIGFPEMIDAFIRLRINPLYLHSQYGPPVIAGDGPTPRFLHVLNYLVKQNAIETPSFYFKLIGINDEREFNLLIDGELELSPLRMLDTLQMFRINPVYIWNPLSTTPLFI